MVCFDPSDILYKSKIGAVAAEEAVQLRITVPRSLQCCGARLVVRKENEHDVSYGMLWAGMNGSDNEWWGLHFTATTPGLYWYRFEIDTALGVNTVTKAISGMGEFDCCGADFQLTVNKSDYVTPKWLRGGVIYQIFPDRFFKSGKAKENVPSDRDLRTDWGGVPYWRPDENGRILNNDFFCGDLDGICQKLDYLSDLGVSCIYLNPIFEAHSNHRYDTADYMAVDPILGNEHDLKRLCSEAKKRGIRIILDGVFSHTGCDSRYFNIYSRYRDKGAYNSQSSPYYPWYKFIDWPQKYHSWWGIELLPEIIEENSSFQEFVFGDGGVIEKWLDCGVGGWRLDVADELPDVFLDRLRQCVKKKNSDAVIIGEVWEDATTKFSYGKRRRYLLGDQLDSVMNYPFAEAILSFVRLGDGELFAKRINEIVQNYPSQALNILMNHIGTHDTERAITRLAGDYCSGHGREWQSGKALSSEQYENGVKMLKLASLIQYTLPGVPSLYYGDEAGMQGYRDPFNRGCFPWDNINKELHAWYVRLGKMRKNCSAFKDGVFKCIYAGANAAAYVRQGEKSRAVIAVNRGNEPISIEIGSLGDRGTAVIGNAPSGGKLYLPSMSAAVIAVE